MRYTAQTAALAAVASLALFTSTAQASACWYPEEAQAAQVRDLHLMLMVGALHCQYSNPAAVKDYNAFVTQRRSLLNDNASLLKLHFAREGGADNADYAYDRYSTTTANMNESKFVADPDSCARMDLLAKMAAAGSTSDLLVLAQTIDQRQFDNFCLLRDGSAPADASTKPAIVAQSSPPTETDGNNIAQSAPPAAALTAASDPQPAGDALPVVSQGATTLASSRVSGAPSASAEPSATNAEQTKAAIAALQAAVVALQATVPATPPQAQNVRADSAKKSPELVAVRVQDAPIIPPKE